MLRSSIGTTALLAVSLALSLFVGYPIKWVLSRLNVVDVPNDRSNHKVPILRGGGLGLVLVNSALGIRIAMVDYSAVGLLYLVLSIVIAAVSFYDDRYSMRWYLRLAVQIGVSSCFVIFLFERNLPEDLAITSWRFIFGLAAIFYVTGYQNAFNFMDGINGLAASQAVLNCVGLIGICLAARINIDRPVFLFAAVLAGSAGGFLPHNFPKAKMFLGDVGSVTLGFAIASLSLWIVLEVGIWMIVPLVALHSNFVLDTAVTLLRRIRQGKKPYEAHREHYYQLLVRSGRSHLFVTALEVALQIVIIVAFCFVVSVRRDFPWLFLWLSGVWIAWIAFFSFCRSRFAKSKIELAR
jgi:UDP-N-acetylmuramyl pentapeptide phosphotransferase/UDP-N-acetylglucosamine-1-phosphate transferase